MRKEPVELGFVCPQILSSTGGSTIMIVDRYDPVNLFEMVLKLNLRGSNPS